MSKKTKISIGALIAVLLLLSLSVIYFLKLYKRNFNIKQLTNQEVFSNKASEIPLISLVAKNLEVPWSMVFLPDKSMLFTERPGRVRVLDRNGNLQSQPVATIEDVQAINEGGLLGITVHPKFSENKYIYLHYTYDAAKTLNRVVRFRYENAKLIDKKIIVDAIPGAAIHNGGRIKFGPDGFLYIATGDSANPSLAQDKTSLAGKILRVSDEGQIAKENPFGSNIYSYGHRNPQGLTWDDKGRLWATEHGQTATDELNLIRAGKNYGWPDIFGDQTKSGMERPVAHSENKNWAPSGAAFYKGSIYFAGLRGMKLYRAKINGDKVEIKEYLNGAIGRIRDVVVGPDGYLYISTSNRDGRNAPIPDDDRILRVNPEKLN